MEFFKDILNITKGRKVNFSSDKIDGDSFRYIQIEDLRNNNQLKYTNESKCVFVNEKDIIIAWDGANAGTIGFGLNGIIGSTLAKLTVKKEFVNKCNSIYLGYFLSSKFEYFQNTSTGAIIPHLSRSALERLPIPLPDIETQNKVVAILDKVKTILNKRQDTITKHDELIRAFFLDTFGNPMERPNQWKLDTINKCLINLSSGTSYGGENKKKLTDDELGVLKVSAITKGFFNADEFKAVKKSIIKRQTIHPQKGDLLFSRANTLELVGATCILDANYDRLFLSDKIWKIETDESLIKKTYLHYVLQNKDVRKTFLSIATGSSGSMLNISMDKFRNIIIPYPPIELQEQFEKTFLKYSGLKAKLKKAHQDISDLFGSISELAFKGELNFNTAVDLEILLENDYTFFKKNSNKETIRLLLKRLDKDELNSNKFYEQDQYNKAKEFVFELLKEDRIKQIFDEKFQCIKLTVS
ncbi:restriction endonuclease subunit S [Flavobacterium sp. KJJ]|uniref:restriction endonuclease subunit S n=1 Tax=Flavobacterium sp. KJJ TaxID=1270193 RepID=UPI00068DC8AE|nr:restriction endonuclease subunit S [Flavobacterium sp. KJJ]